MNSICKSKSVELKFWRLELKENKPHGTKDDPFSTYHIKNGGRSFQIPVHWHDELEIMDKDGKPPLDHRTGLPSSTTAISYRSEPMRNRMPLSHDPADSGEDISMSSWVYGDPAPPILRAYVGDPAKIRLIHGGIKETHVFHLHNHQWRLEGKNPVSTIIDSITISPQECYTLDILYGAGSRNRVIGDVIFHCHLYPHFHEGMWTLWRIYDRLEDGKGKLPDGSSIPALLPLKDREQPPKKDKLHPGYPNFIFGESGKGLPTGWSSQVSGQWERLPMQMKTCFTGCLG